MSEKISLTFLADPTVVQGGEDAPLYRAGQSYEFNEASANHWLIRGVAVRTEDYVPPAEAEKESEPSDSSASDPAPASRKKTAKKRAKSAK